MTFRSRFAFCLVFALSFGAIATASYLQDTGKELPQEEEKLWQYAGQQSSRQTWREGVRAYNYYIKIFPAGKYIEQAYLQMGNLHMRRSRLYSEARSVWEEFCREFPGSRNYWNARFSIAQAWQREGNNAKAIKELENVVEKAGKAGKTDIRTSAIQRIWRVKKKYFRLYVNQTFTVSQKAVVQANMRGIDKVEYRISRIPFEEVLERLEAGDGDNLAGALDRVPKDRWEKLKGWTETYDPNQNRWRNESITIPSEKAGIYVVDGTHDKLTMSVTLFVNRFGVITKTVGGKLLVFAQERATSKPIEGMQIQVLHKTNPVSGKTGEDGVFLSDAYKGGTIIGIKDGELVTTSTYYYSYNQNQPLVYIYTDRPIYRPNQQVQFKIVSRTREGSKLNIAPGKKMAVEIRDAKNNVIYKETHSLNEFGSTFGTMTLGDEPALGMYTISLTPEGAKSNNYRWGRYGSNVGQFRVDEYRKPEYKVGVTFEKEAVLQGHTVEATVNAMYYFGSPVADAKVEYTILRSRFWSYWRWWDGYYDWYLEENSRFYMPGRRGGERVTTGTGTTDSEGNLVIRFTPEKQEYDAVYTLRAKVTDLSRRSVDGAGTVKATRAEFGMNVSLDRWVYKPGDRINAKIRVRTHQGELVPDQKLRVSAYEVEYRKQKNRETKIYEGTTTSDEHGIATIDFTPDLAGGRVRLVVQSQDRFGNAVEADRSIWIYSNRWSSGTWNFNGLDLIPDKKFYEKGDTAKILVTSQFKNVSVLLTLEGADVFFHKIVKIRGNAQLVEIPLDNLDYVPNVFVSVCALKDNAMVRKYKSIVVNPAEKFVNIELVPDKERYEPRETATYTIRTTGSDGKPVSAEVSFGIVDESIYAIQPEIAMDIRKRFVHKRQQSVQTTSSLQYRDWGRGRARESEPKGRGAPAPESDSASLMGAPSLRFAGRKDKNASAYAETVVRSNFADTMYWAASVVTDADGRATITVEIPDNLTTWRATAKAVTKDNRFGQKTGSVITRKDVIVRLELPRFFTQGDRTVITAIAHNYLETAKEMKIVLEVEGFEVEGKKEFVVVVEPEGQKRFDWKTSIPGAGTAKVTVKALTDESSDAMKLEVPILPHGSAKWIARTGFIKGDVSETLTLPEEAIAQASELIVVMSPTHASTVLDALDYLAGYPYGCVEQTMSRFLPTVIAAGTLQKLGIEKPELTKELPLMVSKGLQRLYNFQQGDGGWGWWKNDKSNAHTTAYVLAGLAMAREADFQVSENVLARGISAARRHLGTRGTDPNTKMYLMYALSVAGQKVTGRVGEPESGLSGYGLALQAQILMKNGEEGAAREALGQLVKKVSEGGATAFWEGTGKYGWLGHSVEITAQAMRAIVAIDPEHPLLLKVINWLLQARKGNYWASTKQTAMVVFAMTDYLALTGEMDLDMTLSMDLNGRRIFSEHVTKENWQKFKGIWKFKADEFNRGDNTISFGKTGNGNPVYSIYLKYFANEEFFEASKGGITVERTYYRVAWDGKKRHRVELEEGATVKSGDEIEVTCRIRGDRNYEYLMLEIPMPSGFEAVREQRQRYGWRWNWWYSHKEFRDEKVAVAMTNLHQSNDNVITYTMRAERPGKYSVLPAIVFDMYYPQIGGNSREFRVTVVD